MLDSTSQNIISELFRDGRYSNAVIAQKLGISAITAAKKIETMVREEIISFKAIPNPLIMGNHASAFIGLNVEVKKLAQIYDKLKQIHNINIMGVTFGRFDIILIVYFPTWGKLEDFTKNGLPEIDGIRSVYTFLISEVVMGYKANFDTDLENHKPDLDQIDVSLISELIKNGRPQYSELAHKLDTSISTISRRITSLIDHNILHIVAIPNHSLEYLANAFILLNVDFSKIDEICEKISGYSGTHLVIKLMNDNRYDVLLTVNSAGRDGLFNFITEKVGSIKGVLNSETFVLTNFFYFNVNALFSKSIYEVYNIADSEPNS